MKEIRRTVSTFRNSEVVEYESSDRFMFDTKEECEEHEFLYDEVQKIPNVYYNLGYYDDEYSWRWWYAACREDLEKIIKFYNTTACDKIDMISRVEYPAWLCFHERNDGEVYYNNSFEFHANNIDELYTTLKETLKSK